MLNVGNNALDCDYEKGDVPAKSKKFSAAAIAGIINAGTCSDMVSAGTYLFLNFKAC